MLNDRQDIMALRSSITDPLRIDSVRVGECGGRVGLTFCPGKKQLSSITGGWKRDVFLDLLAVRDWGAQVLVSLLEPHEFVSLGVPPEEFSRVLDRLGIEWIDAPIVDGSIPDGPFLDKWRMILPRLRGIVDRGGAIVFCCMGGLGRTGMMAACLLIETGNTPPEAVAAVRTARPGTIENKDQEDFVLNYRAK